MKFPCCLLDEVSVGLWDFIISILHSYSSNNTLDPLMHQHFTTNCSSIKAPTIVINSLVVYFIFQLWTTLSVWLVPPGYIWWISVWTTRLLAEFWEPLGDRTGPCFICSEGVLVISILCWSFFIIIINDLKTVNFFQQFPSISCCDAVVLWECWRGTFEWWKM